MAADPTGVETVAVFPPALGLALYVQRFEDQCCSQDDFWDLKSYDYRVDRTPIARDSENEKHCDPFTSTTCLLWVWINLLPFAIDNQRQPAEILEDKHNKPWQTVPSGRMTRAQAKRLVICLYPAAACVSLGIGGIRQ